jgi:hypothetical protein
MARVNMKRHALTSNSDSNENPARRTSKASIN